MILKIYTYIYFGHDMCLYLKFLEAIFLNAHIFILYMDMIIFIFLKMLIFYINKTLCKNYHTTNELHRWHNMLFVEVLFVLFCFVLIQCHHFFIYKKMCMNIFLIFIFREILNIIENALINITNKIKAFHIYIGQYVINI